MKLIPNLDEEEKKVVFFSFLGIGALLLVITCITGLFILEHIIKSKYPIQTQKQIDVDGALKVDLNLNK